MHSVSRNSAPRRSAIQLYPINPPRTQPTTDRSFGSGGTGRFGKKKIVSPAGCFFFLFFVVVYFVFPEHIQFVQVVQQEIGRARFEVVFFFFFFFLWERFGSCYRTIVLLNNTHTHTDTALPVTRDRTGAFPATPVRTVPQETRGFRLEMGSPPEFMKRWFTS